MILVLPSIDGFGFERYMLYPAEWPPEKAIKTADDVIAAAKTANPEEWGWEDIEPELVKRGFVVVPVAIGPNWDE